MNGSCVLMYHGIADVPVAAQDIGTNDPVYTVPPAAFAAQLEYLRESGRSVSSVHRHLAAGAPANSVVLTFDDGNKSDATVALPLLQRLGFTATFYVTTAWIGRPGFMNEADIRRLDDAGMEIGSHGHSHSYFDEMTVATLEAELARSTSILQGILDKPVRALGAPGGRLHPRLTEIAKGAGILSIGTSRAGMFVADGDHYSIPRMPVKQATTIKEFRRMTSGDTAYYRRQAVRAAALNSAKRLFGNRRYEQLRSRFRTRS